MNNESKNNSRLKRKKRVRAKISGSISRPRLAVFKSLTSLYVQVIDDKNGKTLVSARTKDIKAGKNTIIGAKELGILIAKKCLEAKIETIVFDRGGYKYHGKIKAIAEGAREGGLKF
jgi:large subunit ribosomal protein L18